MRSGSSTPGSWTRMRSSPWRWMVGSRTPVSSMRRRMISMDWFTAARRRPSTASSVSTIWKAPPESLSISGLGVEVLYSLGRHVDLGRVDELEDDAVPRGLQPGVLDAVAPQRHARVIDQRRDPLAQDVADLHLEQEV